MTLKRKLPTHMLAVALAALLLLNSVPAVTACGYKDGDPEPIYVSRKSPDLPFEEFTNGKIGIVRPSFGRKTLFIAYRYLNGGSFTTEEQNELVEALNGTAPEEKGWEAVRHGSRGEKSSSNRMRSCPRSTLSGHTVGTSFSRTARRTPSRSRYKP